MILRLRNDEKLNYTLKIKGKYVRRIPDQFWNKDNIDFQSCMDILLYKMNNINAIKISENPGVSSILIGTYGL